jgi:hypothetical protein
MIATGVIVVKGWQLYGPSTEQVKTFAVTAVEAAQTAWNRSRAGGGHGSPANDDPRGLAPALAAAAPAMHTETAPQFTSGGLVPGAATAAISAPELATQPAAASNVQADSAEHFEPAGVAETNNDLAALFSQLAAMGVSDQQLTTWGTSGRLYRFSCCAKLDTAPLVERHFEAVAEQQVAAVREVIGEVEAWRTAQRDETAVR